MHSSSGGIFFPSTNINTKPPQRSMRLFFKNLNIFAVLARAICCWWWTTVHSKECPRNKLEIFIFFNAGNCWSPVRIYFPCKILFSQYHYCHNMMTIVDILYHHLMMVASSLIWTFEYEWFFSQIPFFCCGCYNYYYMAITITTILWLAIIWWLFQ